MLACGMTGPKIADTMGVSAPTIYAIKKRAKAASEGEEEGP